MLMDPNELIKHAPELLKGGAALAGALKFTDVVKAMLGPATGEIAERFRDDVRRYRYGRQLDCLKKAGQMAKDAGFTPKAVPTKILFPLLEGASLEENEDLHTMWAALLANAAAPATVVSVRPGFIAILKQIAPDEAKLLNWMLAERSGKPGIAFNQPFAFHELLVAHSNLRSPGDADGLAYNVCIQSLHSEQLVEPIPDAEHFGYLTHSYSLTARGLGFILACRPPQPAS